MITTERIAELRTIIATASLMDEEVNMGIGKAVTQREFYQSAKLAFPQALDTIEAQQRRIEELEAALKPPDDELNKIYSAQVSQAGYDEPTAALRLTTEQQLALTAFMVYNGSSMEFIRRLRAIGNAERATPFESMQQMHATLGAAQETVTRETPLLRLLVDAEIEATRARLNTLGRLLGEPRYAYTLAWDERDALTHMLNTSRDFTGSKF